MSTLFIITGVLLVALLLLRHFIKVSQAADPECDYDEGEEEVVAMGGQVDEHEDHPEEKEPSQEEDSKS